MARPAPCTLRHRTPGRAAVAAIALVTAACGSTEHFVDQPQLMIDGGQQDARQAVAQLFGSATPYTIKLCEANPSSKQCKAADEGISATGVGGLFLPLFLHVHGMHVSQERPSADGLAIKLSFDSNADGIPPICATADGKIISRDNNTALIQASNFYCNWMAVGNVLVNADLSIDRIDLKDKSFTGYYKLGFYGTGNVSGSGYYRAVVTPNSPNTT
ncbi:MAG: hypothetical protein JO255_16970 [Alphaproteobacteria bacterium]|nr:hypothetical protein [Alphaproteobacteria bacterium]